MFESAADEVLAGTFDLAAADRASLEQAFGIVQVGHVVAEFVPQLFQTSPLRGVGGEAVASVLPRSSKPSEQRGAERVGQMVAAGEPSPNNFFDVSLMDSSA